MPKIIGETITSLHFAEDYVDSWYDHTHSVIVMTWFNLTTKVHYRASYLAQLEAAKIFKPKALIIDTSKAFGMAFPEDHKWLITSVFPETKKLDLKFIINIFPTNSITRTGVKNIIDNSKKFEFRVLEMPSIDEAYDFIQSHHNSVIP